MYENEIEVAVIEYDQPLLASLFRGRKREVLKRVNVVSLSDSLVHFLRIFRNQISALEETSTDQMYANSGPEIRDVNYTDGFEIDEIELNFGVSTSGSISLIAKAEIGAQAAIKVKLKRKRENSKRDT